jgi:hypothetical protein
LLAQHDPRAAQLAAAADAPLRGRAAEQPKSLGISMAWEQTRERRLTSGRRLLLIAFGLDVIALTAALSLGRTPYLYYLFAGTAAVPGLIGVAQVAAALRRSAFRRAVLLVFAVMPYVNLAVLGLLAWGAHATLNRDRAVASRANA